MVRRTAAGPEELTGFLERLTRLMLSSSGEGAESVARAVTSADRACGGEASVLLVPDGAVPTAGVRGVTRTVTVRSSPR
ncbi:hypothetical protein [Streptomyces sp. NPDC048473]|uniref:hypothetical protein n=1 Tax=unclassified Streptomyces TaxID=2593676 RepID=UPI003721373A